MSSTRNYSIIAFIFAYFTACSPMKFEKIVDEESVRIRQALCPKVCDANGENCIQRCQTEKIVGEGLVDILIVNDNSGSMSYEQRKMADRFPDFLSAMENLDYRIAMITTDVSSAYSSTPAGIKNLPGPYNGYGALQDGNLIEFSSGLKYISRSTPGKESLFRNTIQRSETLHCENSGYRECPSGDERGIFAANLVLDRTASQFMRPLAHLAVIILSDEDERGLSDSRSVQSSDDERLRQMYPLENYDLPETFVSKVRQKFPEKTFSVHSIIVKPGDTSCRIAQSSQGDFVRGVEGYSYARLSQLTGGVIGTICASDYGSQLREIGYALQGQVSSVAFLCRPLGDNFNVEFIPQPSNNVRVTADFAKLELKIHDPLPPLTKVRLRYDCSMN
jgi:hypothetical protein